MAEDNEGTAAETAASDTGTAPAEAPQEAPQDTPAEQPAQTQTQPVDFREHLSEELRNDPSLRDIKDLEGLAKSYVNAQKLVGADRSQLLQVPGEDADEETLNEFYSKLGRPDTKDDYQLPTDEVFEEGSGLQRDEQMEEWYKDTAHKLGLTNQQAKTLYQEYFQHLKGQSEAQTLQMEQMRDQAERELKQEWGAKYDVNVQKAIEPLRQHADDQFIEMLETTGLGSHPTFIKTMASIAEALGEDTVGDRTRSESLMTPGEAQQEIARLQADRDFMKAYTDNKAPNHQYAVQKMTELHKFMVGANAAGDRR